MACRPERANPYTAGTSVANTENNLSWRAMHKQYGLRCSGTYDAPLLPSMGCLWSTLVVDFFEFSNRWFGRSDASLGRGAVRAVHRMLGCRIPSMSTSVLHRMSVRALPSIRWSPGSQSCADSVRRPQVIVSAECPIRPSASCRHGRHCGNKVGVIHYMRT